MLIIYIGLVIILIIIIFILWKKSFKKENYGFERGGLSPADDASLMLDEPWKSPLGYHLSLQRPIF